VVGEGERSPLSTNMYGVLKVNEPAIKSIILCNVHQLLSKLAHYALVLQKTAKKKKNGPFCILNTAIRCCYALVK
jgi:hypothetical protein